MAMSNAKKGLLALLGLAGAGAAGVAIWLGIREEDEDDLPDIDDLPPEPPTEEPEAEPRGAFVAEIIPASDRKINLAICAAWRGGIIGDEPMALAVASQIWPAVPWPAQSDDHKSVREEWRHVTRNVESFALRLARPREAEAYCSMLERAGEFGPLEVETETDVPGPVVPGGVQDGDVVVPGGVDGAEPPPTYEQPPGVDLSSLENLEYPSGGRFYQVRKGDTLLGTNRNTGIVYRWLLGEAYKAATEIGGLDPDAARSWATQTARNKAVRTAAYNWLVCGPFNDVNFGTYGFDASIIGVPGPHGKSFRLLPIHGDVRGAIASGEAPQRNVELGTPETLGDGRAGAIWRELGRNLEYLWMPPLDLTALWESRLVRVDPQPWPTDVPAWQSRINPPPQVMALGQIAGGDAWNKIWGCEGYGQILYGEGTSGEAV